MLDNERLLYGPRSALHGIPVLVKDNIGTVAFEGIIFIDAFMNSV